MRKTSFYPLELALLLALAVTLLWGAWSLHRQDALQEKMIRLHVIANSDSDADQTLKLCVRDAVLCRAEEILRQSADMTEARARLRESLPAIGNAAAQELEGTILVGSNSKLTLSLTDGSQFTGCVSGEIENSKGTSVSAEVGTVSVTLDETSTWILTADTYITDFTGDASRIISNGYTLYVNGVALEGTK